MTDNTTPEPNEELRERITEYLVKGGLFNPEMMEHEKVRELLRDCREQLVPQGCKCVCHAYPQHDLLQDALEALKWHQQEFSRVRAEERERAKAEVAAAYEESADEICTCCDPEEIAEFVKTRTPADASRALELAILNAKIEEAKYWISDYWGTLEDAGSNSAARLSDYEALREALAKEAAK